VLVLEPKEHLGGGTGGTEEFAKGFKGDIGLTSGKLDDEVVKDLQLNNHGLKIIERDSLTSLLPGGKSFTLPRDRDLAAAVISDFSSTDAKRYKPFLQLIDSAVDFLKAAYKVVPPVSHPPAAGDLEHFTELVKRLRSYGDREMTEIMRLLVMPVRDLLDEWFESDALKGLLAEVALRGVYQGPYAGSTTFSLLHHLAVQDGLWRTTAAGGLGAIAGALAAACKSHGAEVRTNVGEMHIDIADGKATGVRVGAEKIEATTIISDFDAGYTFNKLVAPPELEPEFNRAVRNVQSRGGVARINLALSGLPEFAGVTKTSLASTVVIAPGVAYLERAHDATKAGKFSEQPLIEFCVPSLEDPTLAPAGRHLMSVWVQYVPPDYFDWKHVLDVTVVRLSEFAPGLKSLIEHSQVLLPRDFENKFNLTGGHLFGGEINLSQAFFLRPIPGFANYRTPIENLYLCGAATHPGGGAHGLGGLNLIKALGVKSMVTA
jgi:phytoene dehydrogenase-like protein